MKGEHSTAVSASQNLLCAQGNPDLDKVWGAVHEEASRIATDEERLAPLMEDVFLSRDSFACASAARLSRKLAREDMTREELFPLLVEILTEHPEIVRSMAWDTIAISERDPACTSVIHPLLYYKGYMAIATYRISHQLWQNGRHDLALYFQSLASEVFSCLLYTSPSPRD